MHVRTVVKLTAQQVDTALISGARSEAPKLSANPTVLISGAHSEAPKLSANPTTARSDDGGAVVNFQWDSSGVECRTVVELSAKEVQDLLVAAARVAVPEGNGGTEVKLLEDGVAEISFQWARKAK